MIIAAFLAGANVQLGDLNTLLLSIIVSSDRKAHNEKVSLSKILPSCSWHGWYFRSMKRCPRGNNRTVPRRLWPLPQNCSSNQ
jgi:hypothetical protein